MLKNIEMRDGIPSLAWLAQGRDTPREWQLPWGGIGQRVDAATMTPREAMALARMDFALRLDPVQNARTGRTIPGERTVHRPDTGRDLGRVNRSYPVETYVRTFTEMLGGKVGESCVDGLIETTIVEMPDDLPPVSVAGVLGNGEQAFITLRLHDASRVADGAAVQRYLTMHSGCDGHTPRTFSTSAISPVCANTLTAALSRRAGNVRRSAKHGSNVAKLTQAIQAAMEEAREDDAIYSLMAQRQLTRDEALACLVNLYGRKVDGRFTVSRKGEEHIESVESIFYGTGTLNGQATGVRSGANTAWDLLQAGTYYLDRVAPPNVKADAQADAGELYTGPVLDWLRRETTDSLVNYRQSLTDILAGVAQGTDIVSQTLMAV